MSNPSPICTVNGSATTNGVDVGAGTTVTIALASIAGANQWSVVCIGTDETTSPAAINASLVINQGAKTATYTAPAAGCAAIFKSVVGVNGITSAGGFDINSKLDPTFSTTFGVFTLAASGNRVGALNETFEGNATYGWLPKINALLRAVTGATITWANDLAGSSSSSQQVVSVTGSAGTLVMKSTAAALVWALATTSPTITQADQTANSTNGQTLLIRSQNATGTTSNGGPLKLQTGTGTTAPGALQLFVGATQAGQVGLTSSDFLMLGGSTVASTGTLRLANNIGALIVQRNAGNSADFPVLQVGATSVQFGDQTNMTLSLRGTTTTIQGASAILVSIGAASGDYITFGVNPAATGVGRYANAASIAVARNAANSADVAVLATDSSNNVIVGGTNAAGVIAKVGATTVLSIAIASGDFIALGSLPAVTGAVRIGNNAIIKGKNSPGSGSADMTLVYSGVGGTNAIQFGDSAQSSTATMVAGSGVLLAVGATTVQSLGIASGDYTAYGTVPATGGGPVRLTFGAGNGIVSRNSANSANRNLIAYVNVGGDSILIGDTGVFAPFCDIYASTLSCRGGIVTRADASNLALTSANGTTGWTVGMAASAAGALTLVAAATHTSVAFSQTATATGNGATTTITAQGSGGGNGNGGLLALAGGALNGSGFRGGVQLLFNGSATEVGIELANVVSTNRVVALNRLAALTSTQMPANTGDGVTYIANATTVPTANSVSGGILYAEAGALKWRGTSGTVTTMGPAEPHCPTCGRDFAHEWQNATSGEHLAVCVPCMLGALDAKGVNTNDFAFVRKLAAA